MAATATDSTLRRFLHGLPGVDQVGAEARVAGLATRSIKKDAKRWALDAIVAMTDLTTLEGADTPGKVRALCAKAVQPEPGDDTVPGGRGRVRLPRPGGHRRPCRGRHAGWPSRRWPPRSRPAGPRST